MPGNMTFVIVIVLAVVAVASAIVGLLVIGASRRVRASHHEAFERAVDGLGTRFFTFYGRPYASAVVEGRRTILCTAPRAGTDVSPVLPGRSNHSIVVRTKLRGTGGGRLYVGMGSLPRLLTPWYRCHFQAYRATRCSAVS